MVFSVLKFHNCTKYLLKTKRTDFALKFTNPFRTYRNISHGNHPTPRGTNLFLGVLIGGFVYLVVDWKMLFGLRDDEKELEELKQYTIRDYYAVYTESPPKPKQTETKDSENEKAVK